MLVAAIPSRQEALGKEFCDSEVLIYLSGGPAGELTAVSPPASRPQAFSSVFQRAVEKAAPHDSLPQRVASLLDSITFSVFQYTTRGLFECDKLTYLAQLAFQVKANGRSFQKTSRFLVPHQQR